MRSKRKWTPLKNERRTGGGDRERPGGTWRDLERLGEARCLVKGGIIGDETGGPSEELFSDEFLVNVGLLVKL